VGARPLINLPRRAMAEQSAVE